ncbi:MAG: hypothetical protein IPF97_12490 [Sphingomonadales bacterium]|nr:hypothetical protein [Sphingomonadales bacterium]
MRLKRCSTHLNEIEAREGDFPRAGGRGDGARFGVTDDPRERVPLLAGPRGADRHEGRIRL